jgi:hypothetical protein
MIFGIGSNTETISNFISNYKLKPRLLDEKKTGTESLTIG